MTSPRSDRLSQVVVALSMVLAACARDVAAPAQKQVVASAPVQAAVLLDERTGPAVHPNSERYRDRGLKPAVGRSGTAMLSARALRDRDGVTTLEVSTGPLDGAPRGELAKVQIKALDANGLTQLTQNDNRPPRGGLATYPLVGRVRGSEIQVQANVRGADPRRTDVVTVKTTVALRPDVAVGGIGAPERVLVNAPVAITGTLRELNGDLGAVANCVLYVDGARADQATAIWVDAGGVVSCEFAHVFERVGMHALEVRADGVAPTDFDAANNAASVSVEVYEDVKNDFSYSAAAFSREFRQQWSSEGFWKYADETGGYAWSESSHSEGREQGAWMNASRATRVVFPLTIEAKQLSGSASAAVVPRGVLSARFSYEDSRKTYGYACGESRTLELQLSVCAGYSVWNGVRTEYTQLRYMRGVQEATYYSAGTREFWGRAGDGYWSGSSDYASQATIIDYAADYRFDVTIESGGESFRAYAVIPLASDRGSEGSPTAVCTDGGWGDGSDQVVTHSCDLNFREWWGVAGTKSGN